MGAAARFPQPFPATGSTLQYTILCQWHYALCIVHSAAVLSSNCFEHKGKPSSVATMQRALKSLERAQWLRGDDSAAPSRYRLEDPLFAFSGAG